MRLMRAAAAMGLAYGAFKAIQNYRHNHKPPVV